ncbi:MAG: hypothetical protein EOO62_04130 [Hymenobacter sp.]|nr:MAG: hypothetical protein EOO62_04130 [Hymenobacter sp.]
MVKLLSFLSLLAAATGCGDCEPVSLTPGERAWVSAYRPGQQVCNQLESGKYQAIRSTMVLTSATAYSSASPSFSLLAYKTHPDHPAQLTFILADLLCQATDPPGSPNPRLIKLDPEAITLAGGHRYPAAQRMRSGQHGTIHMGNSQLRAAWWDQQAGLLRYELASGEVFDLVAE